MIVLTIRTDKPEAEIGLYRGSEIVACETWLAHRQLAETLHIKIRQLLLKTSKQLVDIEAIACYAGPGSFTGLRIGLTVANALAYALEIPIKAISGENWTARAIQCLEAGISDPLALPEYGADVHITTPKH